MAESLSLITLELRLRANLELTLSHLIANESACEAGDHEPSYLLQEFTMTKHLLAGSLLVALAASMGGLPVQAQETKPAPAAQPAPATKPTPAVSPVPASPSTAQAKVSSDELKKFASATKQLLAIVNETETQMVQVVEKQGFSQTRFNEIYQSKRNPGATAAQVTPKEEEGYKQVVSQLTQIQKDAQAKMAQAVQAQGIPMERFNQIFAAVQQDPQLKQEVRKMIQN